MITRILPRDVNSYMCLENNEVLDKNHFKASWKIEDNIWLILLSFRKLD